MVAVGWTDYAGSDERDELPKSPSHLLEYDGLVQAAELIERLRQEGRCRRGKQKRLANPKKMYDENKQSVETSSEVK